MKKILKLLLVFILVIGFAACGKTDKKEGKVKVYVFEAGGCPYCEQEIEYLNSLESLSSKFEVVRKELYVDHIDWEPGKDFNLGAKVATAFNEKGYTDATYQATPFVVISDIYASSGLNTNLEEVIKKAYEEGDNDVVECFTTKDSCDIRKLETETDKAINNIKKTYTINFIIIYVLIALIIGYLLYTRRNNNKTVVSEETPKKKTVKKASKKKN